MGCDLIVNADDLGLSKATNAGIIAAHCEGIVTATSLMAVGSAFAHAVDLLKATPSLDLGIHLTLVEERPILSADHLPSLTGGTGRFPRDAFVFTARYLTGRIRLAEIRSELAAQIEAVLSAGLTPSHLDSHQHLHLLPGIWQTTCELARRFGIKAVRRPRERPQAWHRALGAGAGRLAQMTVLGAFCLQPVPEDLRAPDRFTGFAFGGGLDRERLLATLDHLPKHGGCELMCHPGHDDPASPYRHWGYQSARELAALTAPAVRDRIVARSIRLISFRDLSARS